MGASFYDGYSRNLRHQSAGTLNKSASQIFTQSETQQIHPQMSPIGLKKRECFDSDVHPNTVPIILGMDETGSMGRIPEYLVKEGLPHLMGSLIEGGVPDAAVCFLGIGDHLRDRFPLQVGQFESGDEELDLWLTRTFLEGNGGGNGGESYMLAWLFGARHTETHSFTKRNKKGYLITVGDEPCHPTLHGTEIKRIMGYDSENIATVDLLEEAKKMYNVYHIHVGGKNHVYDGWHKLLGENVIPVGNEKDIPSTITKLIIDMEKVNKPTVTPVATTSSSTTPTKQETSNPDEGLLM